MGCVGLKHLAAGAAALLVSTAAPAVANCERPAPIHFARGTASAELSGGLARGERNCFTISARGGQRMTVTQTNRGEDNVVLQIYRPSWKIVPSSEGPRFNGSALEGAEEGRDAHNWAGQLPTTGSYLLVIGTSRGGAEYLMRVEVR